MAKLSQLLVTCGLLASCAQSIISLMSGDDEVKAHIAEKEYSLVAFVMPQIESSAALLKEWETVQTDIEAAIAVDCNKASKLCNELDVVSFPTVRLYQRDGLLTRYRGPRRAASIIAFAKRALRPAVQDVDVQKLSEFANSDDFTFIAQLQSKTENENLASRFKALANDYHDRYSFGVATVVDAPSSVWCYNNPDGSQHMAVDDLDNVDSLQKLLEHCTAEAIPQLTRRNELKHLSSGKSVVFYFSNSNSDRESYVKNMKRTAKKYAEFLQFVTVDSTEYPEMARNVGIRSAKGLAVQNFHNGQVFPYKGAVSPDNVDAFILAISEGKVQPWDGASPEKAGSKKHDEL